MNDPLVRGLHELGTALRALDIPFLIGGALASCAYGEMRATFGGDVVAAMLPSQAETLARSLGQDWYTDLHSTHLADRTELRFVHIPTAVKFTVFRALTEFHGSQLERAAANPLRVDGCELPVATAEDILLAKLQWYREGGEVSDRQWRDIGGVIIQNADLDWEYVNSWAVRLGVTDLLARARVEAEL